MIYLVKDHASPACPRGAVARVAAVLTVVGCRVRSVAAPSPIATAGSPRLRAARIPSARSNLSDGSTDMDVIGGFHPNCAHRFTLINRDGKVGMVLCESCPRLSNSSRNCSSDNYIYSMEASLSESMMFITKIQIRELTVV